MERCRGGPLILSDLRLENVREKGAVADLLNTVVRPVAEESDTPGVVLVTAESDALNNKEIIPSLRERLLQVPVQFFDTKEHSTWVRPFECEAVCTFWNEVQDVDIEKSIKAFRFKRQ